MDEIFEKDNILERGPLQIALVCGHDGRRTLGHMTPGRFTEPFDDSLCDISPHKSRRTGRDLDAEEIKTGDHFTDTLQCRCGAVIRVNTSSLTRKLKEFALPNGLKRVYVYSDGSLSAAPRSDLETSRRNVKRRPSRRANGL